LKKFCDEWIRRQASLGTNPGYWTLFIDFLVLTSNL
jgi:hypothetical protein